jgi:NADH-quinone oxidoreductase subunit M
VLLSALTFLPVVFALVIIFNPQEKITSKLSLVFSGLLFILSLVMLYNFNPETSALQFVEKAQWIPQFGIHYFLGVDGISLWLVMLSNFLLPLVIIGSMNSIKTKVRSFYAALFLLQASMVGSFLSLDLILFYVFFESSLIPMAMMIGIWGGDKKVYASMKFFIYTMFGSVFMLASIICLMLLNKAVTGELSSNVLDLYRIDIAFVDGRFFSTQTLLFLGFAIAFAIKVPMFPLHTWLPDAHVQAPTPGSVILAGVMLKMGTYGFLRFAIPLFPDASSQMSWAFSFLAVIGIIYGALVAMVQTDIKKLVAYSSVSHMGYIILGLFAFNEIGLTGGLYQMLNHGISTGALFFLVGMIYDRTHTREVSAYGGLAKILPIYTIFFLIITFSSIAVPMTNGFVGEFYILLGSYMNEPLWGGLGVIGVILGATYMLWMIKKVFFGPTNENLVAMNLKDITRSEYCVMVPLVVFVFWMGLFPGHFLQYSKQSLANLSENINNYELKIADEVLESNELISRTLKVSK